MGVEENYRGRGAGRNGRRKGFVRHHFNALTTTSGQANCPTAAQENIRQRGVRRPALPRRNASRRPTRSSREQGRRRPDKGQRNDSPEAALQPASRHWRGADPSDTTLGQRASPTQRVNSKRKQVYANANTAASSARNKRSFPPGEHAPKQLGQADGPRVSAKGRVGQPIFETARPEEFTDRRETRGWHSALSLLATKTECNRKLKRQLP